MPTIEITALEAEGYWDSAHDNEAMAKVVRERPGKGNDRWVDIVFKRDDKYYRFSQLSDYTWGPEFSPETAEEVHIVTETRKVWRPVESV